MKANILVTLAVVSLATAANAQSLQASGAASAQAGVSASAVAAQLFADVKGSVIATYDATIVPTVNGSVATYESVIAPTASYIAKQTSKAAKHIRVYYVQPTLDTGAASVNAATEAAVSINQSILIPVGNLTVNGVKGTGEVVEMVAVNAWDFSKEVGTITANGAQASWDQVLVPLAVATGETSADLGNLSVQYVLMPVAEASEAAARFASAAGTITGEAATGVAGASGEFSGKVSGVSGAASGNLSGASRVSAGTEAKERRAQQRAEAEKALKGAKKN